MRQQDQLHLRRAQRGAGLIDGLIALAILSFGILGISQFQNRLVMTATESQQRLTAVQLADELLNTALVDTGNGACYTVPAVGNCASGAARTRALAWADAAVAALPPPASAKSELDVVNGRLRVTLSWWGRETNEERQLVGETDVRP